MDIDGYYLQLRKRAAEISLYEFVQLMWSVVEPATEFVRGRVLEEICRHLEAVTAGKIQKLIINVPPGCSKSLITNVFWPAWEWGPKRKPYLRYLTFSYSAILTERDNDRCTRVVSSELYQAMWGDVVKLEKTGVTKITTNHTGWKFATSIGGVGTGERGDRIIMDDMNDVRTAESKIIRDATNQWLREVMPSRLNNMSKSCIVCIQQRTHEEDATGTLLGLDLGYEHLCLPMRYEGWRAEFRTSIDGGDWREEEGELLWEERFPLDIVEYMEKTLGLYASAGQLQQTPSPRGGGIIQREWWRLWEDPKYPPLEYILATVDTATSTKETADYSACTVWGVWRDEHETPRIVWRNGAGIIQDTRAGMLGAPRLILMHAWQERLTIHDLVMKLIDTCSEWRVDTIRIESKSSGISAAQELHRILQNDAGTQVQLEQIPSNMDKTARLMSVQHLFQEGMVYAPDKEWAQMVIDQVSQFPRGAHDDLVDCTSSAVRYLRDISMALRTREHMEEQMGLGRKPLRMGALYDA